MPDRSGRPLTDLVQAVLPVLRVHASDVDASARFPVENLRALRETGLLGLLVPADYGGLAGGLPDLVEIAQELAAECPSTAMIWAMHCQQVDPLVRYAGPQLRERLLPRIAEGATYLASVTTEPGKGGHLLTGVAPMLTDSGRLWLEREAPVVTGGEVADGFLITMRASEDAREDQLTLVYGDREQLDINFRTGWETLGMRGTASVGLRLAGWLPAWQAVGEPGGFRTIAVESLAPVGHLAWAACWLGIARGALAKLVTLIRSADQPTSLNVRSDLFAERLARIRMDLELVSAYLGVVCDEVVACRAAGSTLDVPAVQVHLNTLKVVAAERTFSAVDRMVQLVGLSLGYRRDAAVPLERYFRDLRSASLNYANDRLLVASGALALLDRSVKLATTGPSVGSHTTRRSRR
jgi:acyl-CoA dehydrogenase